MNPDRLWTTVPRASIARTVAGAWVLAAPMVAAAAQDSAALAAAVRDLIGTPTCSSDDQCRTLPYGAKACGGPQGYVAWSILVTDESALKVAGERFAAQRREELRAGHAVSDCIFVADPGAVCAAPAPSDAARVCVLRARQDAPSRAVR